jgi:MoaA/NifB/PqqE/SkfB family radical SAM enzyme
MKVEFANFSFDIYVNNVCNRTCEGCLPYSNFGFTGNYDWNVSKSYFEKWNSILDIKPKEINLMGGEPLLHPQLLDWVSGLHSIFGKDFKYRVFTGAGPKLLHEKLEIIKKIIDLGAVLDFSIHNRDEYESIVDFLDNFLLAGKSIEKIKIEDDEQIHFKVDPPIDYFVNGVNNIRVTPSWVFVNNNVRTISNKKLFFYNSDPKKAFDVCPFTKCIPFLDGRLYKCPSLVTLQNFSKQVSCDNQALIDSIDSVSPFDSFEKIQEYIESLKYHVKQCSLCPEERTLNLLSNNIKKIKIFRKKK